MDKKFKVVLPVVSIILVMLLSGCTQHNTVKDLSPEDVVGNYWKYIGEGDFNSAYDLVYHSNQNFTKQMWLDEQVVKWGEGGSYITIYSFNVTGSSPINGSDLMGNFTEARAVDTTATVSFKGKNATGPLRMVLVNTTDGWKIYGNY